jgi:inorganic pyrophosphatase
LDVLVLCSQRIIPMTLVRCYPVGVICMTDNGAIDEKIIAIPFDDPTYNSYTDISQIPAHIFDEWSHFFKVYKQLEGKETAVTETKNADEAKKVIQKAIDSYIDNYCK